MYNCTQLLGDKNTGNIQVHFGVDNFCSVAQGLIKMAFRWDHPRPQHAKQNKRAQHTNNPKRATRQSNRAQHVNQTRAARQSKRVQHAVQCASSTPIKTRTARQSNCTQHTNKIVRSTPFKTYAVHESKRAQQTIKARASYQSNRAQRIILRTHQHILTEITQDANKKYRSEQMSWNSTHHPSDDLPHIGGGSRTPMSSHE